MLPTGFDKQPLPFMEASFPPGDSACYIDAIQDDELRSLALCERYYYRGEGAECVALAQPLLKSGCYPICVSAGLMFAFGSLCAGDPKSAMLQMAAVRHEYEDKIVNGISRTAEEKNYAAFISNLATVLLHMTDNPFVEMDVTMLPGGIRLFSFYVLAHNHYLRGEYGQAAGVSETALSLCGRPYPVGEIYLHLIACIAYINLKQSDKADYHFFAAWELAKPEGFIEPFAEHHGLLQGMVEVHLRKTWPSDYEKIIRQVYLFSDAWRKVHNPLTGHLVADNLTTTEFTVAMLASRGWRNEKIAAHMGVSISTIKAHTYNIYRKLSISSRKELQQFMLR